MENNLDSERWSRVQQVFEEVCDQAHDEREPLLQRLQEEDPLLCEEVRSLLAADEEDTGFLQHSAVREALDGAGVRIGAYEIVAPIATGGMGSVYEATQENPRRRVALKVMHTSLTSASGLRRFRYEAEALARLRHPCIAQVHEAGVAPARQGQPAIPFIAMEFVEQARDLVTYAREEGLDLPARLTLFLSVTDAVHHGHQHGVIHRDLKPANILVNGGGQVKVIDFGVARAVSLTDEASSESPATRTGELVGTLQYMSPEQLSGDPASVDTRSDVYALGVVLYELLCDRPPYDLSNMTLVQRARVITETPPERPADLNEEVWWVVSGALAKDPVERFASAAHLGADLRRYLSHEPVLAGPPSTTYRLRKFVRRNRALVGGAALMLATLLIGTTVAVIGQLRAHTAASKFKEINRVLTETLRSVRPEVDGHSVRVVDLLDRAAERIGVGFDGEDDVRRALHGVLAESYMALGLGERARSQAGLGLRSWPSGVESQKRLRLVQVLVQADIQCERDQEALDLVLPAIQESDELLGRLHPLAFDLRQLHARILVRQGDFAGAEQLLAELSSSAAEVLGPTRATTLSIQSEHSQALASLGEYERARSGTQHLVEAYSQGSGPQSYLALNEKARLARLLMRLQRHDAADELYEAVLPPLTEMLGAEHATVLAVMNNMATNYGLMGEPERQLIIFERLLAVQERLHGAEHTVTLKLRQNVAYVREDLGRSADPVADNLELVELSHRLRGSEHPESAMVERGLAVTLMRHGRWEEARPWLLHCLPILTERLGPNSRETLVALESLGIVEMRAENHEAAAEIFERVHEGWRLGLGPEDEKTLFAAWSLATCLAQMGMLDEAIGIGTDVLHARHATLDAGDPVLFLVISTLANQHLRNGSPAQAQELLQGALDGAREGLPEGHEQRAQIAFELARLLHSQRRFVDAAPLFEEAAAVSSTNLQIPRSRHAKTCQLLGQCHVELRDHAAAEAQFLMAYEVLCSTHSPEHTSARALARELERLYTLWDKLDQAALWEERAR